MLTPARWLSTCVAFVALLAACDDPDPVGPGLLLRLTGAAPTNLTATANSYSDISLAWQDNSTNENGWEVHRSTTGPTGTFTLFTAYPWPNTTTGGNSGLQGSTEYCYKVRSYKDQGRQVSYSDFSNVACATTLAAPVTAAPSDVSAAPDPGGRIRVSWTDNAADESGFRVERSATSSGPWTALGTTGPNIVGFIDRQPPAAEQPACYRVFAYNSFGDSQGSNVDCTVMPNAPSALAATATGSNVDLTWTDNSAVEDSFEVHRWTASFQFIVLATLPANTTSYRDPGLVDDTYWYQVRATKDGGSSPGSNNASATVVTMPPIAPSGVDAVPGSSSAIDVTWTDASTNEEGFRLERSSDGGATWVTAATAGPGWQAIRDGGLRSEQQACYRVVAFNRLGDSPPSNTDCATPPAAPSNLVATTVEGLAIDLTWTDNSGVEDGYEVQRVFTDCGYEWGEWVCYSYYEPIATLGPNATSYRHSGLNPGEYYTYVVMALKDGGRSDPSNEAAAWSDLPPAAPSNLSATGVSSGQIDLAWTDNSSDEEWFGIARCQGDALACDDASFVWLPGGTGANATTFSDTGLQPGTTYTYRVVACRGGQCSDPSNEATASTPAAQE